MLLWLSDLESAVGLLHQRTSYYNPANFFFPHGVMKRTQFRAEWWSTSTATAGQASADSCSSLINNVQTYQ